VLQVEEADIPAVDIPVVQAGIRAVRVDIQAVRVEDIRAVQAEDIPAVQVEDIRAVRAEDIPAVQVEDILVVQVVDNQSDHPPLSHDIQKLTADQFHTND